MALSEFSLIEKYFSPTVKKLSTLKDSGYTDGVVLGIGDDAAVLDVPVGEQLVVTVDILVSGVHFPVDADPEDVAYRSLRVNLSDIAAMGAQPRWFTLALTMPAIDEGWLQLFSQALKDDAASFGCILVGGDTTLGPLSISIQMLGTVPRGQLMTRSGAGLGDSIYVTGTLGEAAAALSLFDASAESVEVESNRLLQRFYRPEPRLTEGRYLRNLASAALDVSDGLLADLGHIADAAALGAELEYERLPIASWLKALAEPDRVAEWVLSGGDDYELCFTVPKENLQKIDKLIADGKLLATRIGQMTHRKGVRCIDQRGNVMTTSRMGYQHF